MMEYFKLVNGVEIPVVSFGTYPMTKLTVIKALNYALRHGYESFDTAHAYYNERWCKYGKMFIGKKRENVFITTKISNIQQRTGDIRGALENSLKALGVSYIDLYLMHWPNPETYIKTWKEMEKLYKEGLVRAIGVCNFHQHHFEKLMSTAEIMPMVNQIELHPLLNQRPLVKFCRAHNILVEAYSPLARMDSHLTENKVLKNLAQKYRKSIAQIILRWDLQNGIISIPKSQSHIRMLENIDIFDFALTGEEMDEIDAQNKNYRIRHDPDNCDYSKL